MQKYDASGEQIQCWDRHRLLDSSHHEMLTVDSFVRDLDAPSLKKAIELLITRHESLRTSGKRGKETGGSEQSAFRCLDCRQ